MSKEPAFTVVLAAFNEETYIASAIRSVLAQSRSDFELVVVDDGSRDATADVVRHFVSDPRVRLVQHENKGLASSINTGVEAGSAPLIARIDADDLWMPTYLEEMATVLRAHPDAGFAFTEAWRLNLRSGRFLREWMGKGLGAPDAPSREPIAMFRELAPANWIIGMTTFRRAALSELGGYDESLGACEDYDLWLRFLLKGYAGVRVPGDPLVIYRDRTTSMSTDTSSMYTNLNAMYRGIATNPDLPKDMAPLIQRRIAATARGIASAQDTRHSARAAASIRRSLGRIVRSVLRSRYSYSRPPEQVESAFPGRDWSVP